MVYCPISPNRQYIPPNHLEFQGFPNQGFKKKNPHKSYTAVKVEQDIFIETISRKENQRDGDLGFHQECRDSRRRVGVCAA